MRTTIGQTPCWSRRVLEGFFGSRLPTRGPGRSPSDAGAAQVGVRTLGDRLGLLERRRVHVLLDHHEDLGVQARKGGYHRWDVWKSLRWFTARSPRHRLAEGEVLALCLL